jgi:hypothetical protein
MNTICATNVKTKNRKAESSQSTSAPEIQDGGVKNLTKDENTPKEGERKSHGGARAGVGRKKKEKSQEKYKDNSQTFIRLLLSKNNKYSN